jgi:signal transduction histidine kinase
MMQLEHIYNQVTKGNVISTSSSNLLLLNVEDILGYAQLKADKFIKTIKVFNIKRAIEEIISIQEYQANSRNITISHEFIGFPIKKSALEKCKETKTPDVADLNLLIESDEKRIKQVLMNLQSNGLKFTKEGGKIQIICEFI